MVNFQVEYSPAANQDRAFEFLMGSASDQDPLLTREVERAIRDSRALDTEALCILANKLVSPSPQHWQLTNVCRRVI